MNIKTKFNFKEKVYKIFHTTFSEWQNCLCCDGEAQITGKDNKKRCCPECYGNGGRRITTHRGYIVDPVPMTVGEIQIRKRCEHIGADQDNIFNNYGNQKAFSEERYMCYETGIGTGTLWPAEDLFYLEKEAQKECDIRNLKEKEKEKCHQQKM